MRIMTRTQWDAICDIVSSCHKTIKDQSKEIEELKKKLEQKEITIQYLNACVSKANNRYLELIKKQSNLFPNVLEFISSCDGLDFPATPKPEDNI